MVARKQKLADSLRLQQLFRDIEDEETWIREKEPIAASTNRGWSIQVSLTIPLNFITATMSVANSNFIVLCLHVIVLTLQG